MENAVPWKSSHVKALVDLSCIACAQCHELMHFPYVLEGHLPQPKPPSVGARFVERLEADAKVSQGGVVHASQVRPQHEA